MGTKDMFFLFLFFSNQTIYCVMRSRQAAEYYYTICCVYLTPFPSPPLKKQRNNYFIYKILHKMRRVKECERKNIIQKTLN